MVFAFGVKDAEDECPISVEDEKYLVGKARQQNTPKAAIIKWETICIVLQREHSLTNLLDKTISQTDLLLLIPTASFCHIPFGAGTDDDTPFHASRRRRASTSSQVAPTQGFLS